MTIKAIFFDFDDTLGNRELYANNCYRAIIRDNAQIDDPVLFEAIIQDCMMWDEKGNIDKNHVKINLKEHYGIDLPYEDINAYWNSVLWQYCVPFEDSESTLEYLAGKYKIGLITNGPSEGQRKKLEHAGLARFFDPATIVVSGDYGFHKPDKRLFLIACEKLGVKPEEAVYVGDIFAKDVLGSSHAGMQPVWIWNQGERKCDMDIIIIHKIGELKQYF